MRRHFWVDLQKALGREGTSGTTRTTTIFAGRTCLDETEDALVFVFNPDYWSTCTGDHFRNLIELQLLGDKLSGPLARLAAWCRR